MAEEEEKVRSLHQTPVELGQNFSDVDSIRQDHQVVGYI